MKKTALCVFIVISFMACKKECDDPKTPDPVIIHDTVIVQPACTPNLTKGLLAYYPFNGNFNDESGNGNNASSKNGAYLTTDFLGRANKSAGFDGVNDYLIAAGNSKLNADSITVSYQVMVNNTSRRNVTISRINYETGGSYTFGIHQSVATDSRWNVGVAPGTDDCLKQYPYDPTWTIYSNGLIQAGRWYNITVTFGGGVDKLYVDGVLQSSRTLPFSNAKKCSDADLMIGGWWKADVVSIDGKLDEVRLYGRVLTDCEIAKLAESFKE
jgi:hypothetical protein